MKSFIDLSFFLRAIKRLTVLCIGIGVVYVAITEFFPFFDQRIPLAFALLATYLLTAYIFVPFLFRIYRLFVRPTHIPLYCVTPDGFASDPINIGVIGTRKQIEKAMHKAGWHIAHKRTLKNLLKMVGSVITRKPYRNAPFSTLYLFGRRHDIGFQKSIADNPSHRHHVRFWACHLDGPEEFHKDVKFWQRFHHKPSNDYGRQLWVGAASKDIGIMPIRHNAQITHMIDPDTNTERDLIVGDLRSSHSVEKTLTERVHKGLSLRNRAFRGLLQSDGKIRICILKD